LCYYICLFYNSNYNYYCKILVKISFIYLAIYKRKHKKFIQNKSQRIDLLNIMRTHAIRVLTLPGFFVAGFILNELMKIFLNQEILRAFWSTAYLVTLGCAAAQSYFIWRDVYYIFLEQFIRYSDVRSYNRVKYQYVDQALFDKPHWKFFIKASLFGSSFENAEEILAQKFDVFVIKSIQTWVICIYIGIYASTHPQNFAWFLNQAIEILSFYTIPLGFAALVGYTVFVFPLKIAYTIVTMPETI